MENARAGTVLKRSYSVEALVVVGVGLVGTLSLLAAHFLFGL